MTLNIPTYLPFGSFPLNSSKVTLTGVAGKAQCIVTGDKDLLVIARFEHIDIVAPVDFQAYEEKYISNLAP